jgi:hypothetical protein
LLFLPGFAGRPVSSLPHSVPSVAISVPFRYLLSSHKKEAHQAPNFITQQSKIKSKQSRSVQFVFSSRLAVIASSSHQ